MADIAKIDTVAEANIAKVSGRTTAGGDSVMNILFPAVPAGIIESIQEVEITIASSTAAGTATIASVNTAKSAIFFSHHMFGGKRQSSTSNAVNRTLVRVDLTNATTVTAERQSAAGAFPITVRCTVVEFKDAAVDSIQQSSITMTSTNTSATDTITSVDTARSAVVHNGVEGLTSGAGFGISMLDLSLTNATTVTATRDGATSTTSTVNYVVIEFATGIIDSVQEFNLTISDSGAVTVDATISSVDTSRSVIFPGGHKTSDIGSVAISSGVCHGQLLNATTVRATRNTTSAEEPAISGTVVEFAAGKTNNVQRGVATIGSGNLTEDITVTSVDVSLSMVNALGSTSSSGSSFDSEEQTFTIEILNATTIRATRNVSSSRTVIFSWELTEFAA